MPFSRNNVGIIRFWAASEESRGLPHEEQKVASEKIDAPCWRSALKGITGTDSHGSLEILPARLRTRR